MKLPQDVLEKYIHAGRIAREVRAEMLRFVREGMPIIDVCEKAEELILKKGGRPAFPCNVSVDEIAAHYTSPPEDTRVVPKGSLTKVDVGVHIEGYIADTAVTLCFNREHENLTRAAEEALSVAVKSISAGTSTSRLGSMIQRTIENYGCKPVSNLTGHQVGRYLIHAGKSIPNVSHLIGSRIREGDALAIEPFVTTAAAVGKVKDGKEATIFRLAKHRSHKNQHANSLLSFIEANFKTLPFSERWLTGVVPEEDYSAAFRQLASSKCLTSYHTFVEASREPVAQAEHTIIVGKGGCTVLT